MKTLCATLLTLASSLTAGTVSGITVNSMDGQPVAGVDLLLMSNASHFPGAVRMRSDANGHFAFQGVNRDEYRLKVRRRGFLETEYGANGLDERGKPIVAQNSENLRIELAPAALITGTIRDLDGEPVEGAYVVVIKVAEGVEESDSTTTDDQGHFRFSRLGPGKYSIAANTEGNWRAPYQSNGKLQRAEIEAKTYFPGVTSAEQASVFELNAGGQISGIDITLQRRASLTIQGALASALESKVIMVILKDMAGQSSHTFPLKGKGFIFTGLESGSYQLIVEDKENKLAACKPLDMRNEDVNNLELHLVSLDNIEQIQRSCPGWTPTSESFLRLLMATRP